MRQSSTDILRLKLDLWTPIANELDIPWHECEAIHWAIGRKEMARLADAIPFAIATADAEPREPGQVAQSDRTLESTQVSPFAPLALMGVLMVTDPVLQLILLSHR